MKDVSGYSVLQNKAETERDCDGEGDVDGGDGCCLKE